MDPTQAIARVTVRRQIRDCRACDLACPPTRLPVPFSGPTPASFIVLGEAPGRTENHRGEPFVGASGRFLRRLMRATGLNDGDALFCNVASCWPPGAPTAAQATACRPNLVAQLKLAGTPYVLAAGRTALLALVPDGDLNTLHGCALTIRLAFPGDATSAPFTVVPVYHPAFVLAHDPSSKPTLEQGLVRFKSLLDGVTADLLAGDRCVKCHHRAEFWDRRQMPFCFDHRKLIAKGQRMEARRRKAVNKALQEKLI